MLSLRTYYVQRSREVENPSSWIRSICCSVLAGCVASGNSGWDRSSANTQKGLIQPACRVVLRRPWGSMTRP